MIDLSVHELQELKRKSIEKKKAIDTAGAEMDARRKQEEAERARFVQTEAARIVREQEEARM